MNEFTQRLSAIRNGFTPKTTGAKEKVAIKKVSDKKAAEMKAAKETVGTDDTPIQKWFLARRKELTGTCQCGCGRASSKRDDNNFRSSCCHVFPKAIFKTIALHPINCVERNFWDGCHSNMDNQSLDKWPMMADWEDIKERFHVLAPLLTDEERKHKFYKHLEKLIYSN